MIAAMRAVLRTSPLGTSPAVIARSVAGWIEMKPSATASRAVIGLPPTSTIFALPVSSRCVSLFAGSRSAIRKILPPGLLRIMLLLLLAVVLLLLLVPLHDRKAIRHHSRAGFFREEFRP